MRTNAALELRDMGIEVVPGGATARLGGRFR